MENMWIAIVVTLLSTGENEPPEVRALPLRAFTKEQCEEWQSVMDKDAPHSLDDIYSKKIEGSYHLCSPIGHSLAEGLLSASRQSR